MKIIVVFMMLLAGTITCKQPKNRHDVFEDKNYIYPDSIFNFFPDWFGNKYKNLQFAYIGITNAKKIDDNLVLDKFDASILIKVYQSDDKQLLESLRNTYFGMSLSTFMSEGNDYFIMNGEREILMLCDSVTLMKKYSQYKDKNIIVNFHELNKALPNEINSATTSGLAKGYKIVILKSGNEFILPEDNRFDWSILPVELKHGYRSGVAFKESKPYIIYWVVAW